jgi:mRNA interferase MazF
MGWTRVPKPSRGEVWQVVLDPVRGHEQAGQRPALIVSTDRFNHSGVNLVFVLPISPSAGELPTHVSVSPPEGGLTSESRVFCEHLRCVSHDRLIKQMGTVSGDTLAAVAERVRYLMEL